MLAKSTAITSTDQTPQCRLLTSSSGGARPAFSAHYSYFTASANGHQQAASFCHTPCTHLICPRCVCVHACVCHCNVCVGSPEWASHKQMGSWKATSHIVTEEIPFFCPQSWWHWWPCRTAPETTEQTRGRPPSLRPYTQMKQMSVATPPLLQPTPLWDFSKWKQHLFQVTVFTGTLHDPQDHSWKFVLGFVQQKAVPVKTVWLSRAVNPN